MVGVGNTAAESRTHEKGGNESSNSLLEELGVMGYRTEVQGRPEDEDTDKTWL